MTVEIYGICYKGTEYLHLYLNQVNGILNQLENINNVIRNSQDHIYGSWQYKILSMKKVFLSENYLRGKTTVKLG